MNATDIIICPGCGWVGGPADLGQWDDCPQSQCGYQFGDGPLPTVTEMMKDSTTTYNDVRMDLFLRSFVELLIAQRDRLQAGKPSDKQLAKWWDGDLSEFRAEQESIK